MRGVGKVIACGFDRQHIVLGIGAGVAADLEIHARGQRSVHAVHGDGGHGLGLRPAVVGQAVTLGDLGILQASGLNLPGNFHGAGEAALAGDGHGVASRVGGGVAGERVIQRHTVDRNAPERGFLGLAVVNESLAQVIDDILLGDFQRADGHSEALLNGLIVAVRLYHHIQGIGSGRYRVRTRFQYGTGFCCPPVEESTIRVIGDEVLGLGGGNRFAVGKLGGIVLVFQSARSLGHGDLDVLAQGVAARGDGDPVGMHARAHVRRQGEAGSGFRKGSVSGREGLTPANVGGVVARAQHIVGTQAHGLTFTVGDRGFVGGEGHALDGDFLHSYIFQSPLRGRLCDGNPGLPVSPEVGTALGQQVCQGAAFNCHLAEVDASGGIGNGHLCAVPHLQLPHSGHVTASVYDLQIASLGAYQLARQILAVQIQSAAYPTKVVTFLHGYILQQLQCAALAIANLVERRLEIGIAGGHAVLGHGGHNACSVAVGAAAGAIRVGVGAGFDGQVVKNIIRRAGVAVHDSPVIRQVFVAALDRIAGFQQASQGHLEILKAVQPKLADAAALEDNGAHIAVSPVANAQFPNIAVSGGANKLTDIRQVDISRRSRPARQIQLAACKHIHGPGQIAGAFDDELCGLARIGGGLAANAKVSVLGNVMVVHVQGDGLIASADLHILRQNNVAQQLHGGAVLGVIQGGGQVGGVGHIAVLGLHHDGHGHTAGIAGVIFRYVLVGADIAAGRALAVCPLFVVTDLVAQIAHAVRPLVGAGVAASTLAAVFIEGMGSVGNRVDGCVGIRLARIVGIQKIAAVRLVGKGRVGSQHTRQGAAA